MPSDVTTTVPYPKTGRFLTGPTDPANVHFTITPSDTVQLTYFARGVFVGGAGNIVAELLDAATGEYTSKTYSNCQAGSVLPISPRRIFTTSTATGLIGLI